jgi:hypothetical protein
MNVVKTGILLAALTACSAPWASRSEARAAW